METKKSNGILLMRLSRGETLPQCIKQACEKHDMRAALVMMGIGQLKDIELGFFRKKGDFVTHKFFEPHELLFLSGNCSRQKDGYHTHIHACLSDIVKNTVGGHLIRAQVTATAEIGLIDCDMEIMRRQDPETGLMTMHFEI